MQHFGEKKAENVNTNYSECYGGKSMYDSDYSLFKTIEVILIPSLV